jgi:hypothetical protein
MLVYALVGRIGAGKTTFAEALHIYTSGKIFFTSKYLAGKHPGMNRQMLQTEGDKLDRDTDGGWILRQVRNMSPAFKAPVIIDCVRARNQIRHLREAYGGDCLVVGITSTKIDEHIQSRNYDMVQMRELLTALQHPLERTLPMEEADLTFDNTRFTTQSLIQIAHFSSNAKKER